MKPPVRNKEEFQTPGGAVLLCVAALTRRRQGVAK
jgi:hypothetical protein